MTAGREERRCYMLGDLGTVLRDYKKTFGAETEDLVVMLATALATVTNVPTDPLARRDLELLAQVELQKRQQILALQTDAPAGHA